MIAVALVKASSHSHTAPLFSIMMIGIVSVGIFGFFGTRWIPEGVLGVLSGFVYGFTEKANDKGIIGVLITS